MRSRPLATMIRTGQDGRGRNSERVSPYRTMVSGRSSPDQPRAPSTSGVGLSHPEPFKPMTRGTRRSLIVWASSILLVPILSSAADLFAGAPLVSGLLSFCLVLAVLVATLLTTYLAIVFVRWVLSRLFWSVGRRLALSYLLRQKTRHPSGRSA